MAGFFAYGVPHALSGIYVVHAQPVQSLMERKIQLQTQFSDAYRMHTHRHACTCCSHYNSATLADGYTCASANLSGVQFYRIFVILCELEPPPVMYVGMVIMPYISH